MNSIRWTLIASCALFATTASAQLFNTNYDVVLDDIGEGLSYGVDDIVIFENGEESSSATWPFNVSGPGFDTIQNPFEVTGGELPFESILLGVSFDLPTGFGNDLVMFVSDEAAAELEGQEFDSLFNYSEEDITNALFDLNSDDDQVVDDAFVVLDDFLFNELPSSLTNDAFFSFGGDFTMIAFTEGKIIGTGTSYATTVIPEPGTMTVLGLGALAMLRRRKKKAA